MALMARLLTLSGLEQEVGKDRRSIGKILEGYPPDGKANGRDAWFIKTFLKASGNSGDGAALDGAAEKARLDKARADLAELDLSVREGRLVPASAIEKAWANIATEIRTRLLSIPASTAPRITGKLTTVEIEAIIREQIDEALNAISGAVIVAEDDDQDTEQPGAVRRDGKGARAVQGVTAA